MSGKAKLGDYLFKGAVTVLAGGSLVAGVIVAVSMADRFAFHRHNKQAMLEGQDDTKQQQ
jgi:hypothetical protein